MTGSDTAASHANTSNTEVCWGKGRREWGKLPLMVGWVIPSKHKRFGQAVDGYCSLFSELLLKGFFFWLALCDKAEAKLQIIKHIVSHVIRSLFCLLMFVCVGRITIQSERHA